MGVTTGNVLIKPTKEKSSRVLSPSEMLEMDKFFQGEIIEVGAEDGLYPLDPQIKVGKIVLVPKIQKQKFPIDGVGHYICHYSEIKYVFE